jgi:hypothetical protein
MFGLIWPDAQNSLQYHTLTAPKNCVKMAPVSNYMHDNLISVNLLFGVTYTKIYF